MNDWDVSFEDRSVTHLPSSSRFWFYNHPNTNDAAGPQSMNLGSSWDSFFASEKDICRAATNIWRVHRGVAPLKD
jgi:hypothetical protein